MPAIATDDLGVAVRGPSLLCSPYFAAMVATINSWWRVLPSGGDAVSNYAKFLCDGLQQLADAVSLKTLAQWRKASATLRTFRTGIEWRLFLKRKEINPRTQ
jgi:hypothetical protein